MMCERDGCWWEKDCERPRLAWWRSSRSLTAGLEGLFFPRAGRKDTPSDIQRLHPKGLQEEQRSEALQGPVSPQLSAPRPRPEAPRRLS